MKTIRRWVRDKIYLSTPETSIIPKDKIEKLKEKINEYEQQKELAEELKK